MREENRAALGFGGAAARLQIRATLDNLLSCRFRLAVAHEMALASEPEHYRNRMGRGGCQRLPVFSDFGIFGRIRLFWWNAN